MPCDLRVAAVGVVAGFAVACGTSDDASSRPAPDGGNTGGLPASDGGTGGETSGAGGRAGSPASSGGRSSSGTGGSTAGAAGALGDAGGGDAAAPPDAAGTAAYPDGTSTGPRLASCPSGALRKYTGSGAYRPQSDEVVSCMQFEDEAIYVAQDVSNVTIENCRFVTKVDVFVNVQGSHVTIQDSRFEGPAGTWIRNSYAGDHLTVRRNEFTGMGNAVEFNVGYEVIEDNFVHDFGTADPGQHADGIQTDGSSHFVIRHNTVLLNDVAGATGAISVFGDSGDDVLVERNKVGGGGYTIYPGATGYTNIRFVDNCFSTIFYPGKAQSGAYGPWYPSNNPAALVRTGNTWCDGPSAGMPLDDNP